MSRGAIPVSEAKRTLGEVISTVRYERREVILTHHGKPVARIVPFEPGHASLADVIGWLADDDPFFDVMSSIQARRARHLPRVSRRR